MDRDRRQLMDLYVLGLYSVQFVLEYSVITTTVLSPDEDSAVDIAIESLLEEIGIKRKVLKSAQEALVETLREAGYVSQM
jgi:endonuclease III